ncbi:hypothetical protein HGM15179_018258 [Zosterops borbonicus]|uniref:Uncharacterized protein n=1 Tax=Zosterops borbonicus TaxID=364589 RepID=A0A8K1FZC5_9PASS|nr:hypothetical protein HGM15179_018258 [Zosterops borbonicus]
MDSLVLQVLQDMLSPVSMEHTGQDSEADDALPDSLQVFPVIREAGHKKHVHLSNCNAECRKIIEAPPGNRSLLQMAEACVRMGTTGQRASGEKAAALKLLSCLKFTELLFWSETVLKRFGADIAILSFAAWHLEWTLFQDEFVTLHDLVQELLDQDHLELSTSP